MDPSRESWELSGAERAAQPWIRAGRHLTHTQVLSPCLRHGKRMASFSLRPQLKQFCLMVMPAASFSAIFSAAASSANSGASRFSPVSAPSGPAVCPEGALTVEKRAAAEFAEEAAAEK